MDSQTSLDSSTSDSVQTNVFDDEGLLFGDSRSTLIHCYVPIILTTLGTCDDPLGSGLVGSNERLTLGKLWLSQFYALLVKRLYYTRGKAVALTIQNIFPLVVICFALWIAHLLQAVPDPPPLELSPHLFFAKSRYNYLFAGGDYTDMTAPLVNSLFQPCGVSAYSVGSSSSNESKCYHNDSAVVQCLDYPQDQLSCHCPSCENFTLPFHDAAPQCYNGTVTGSEVLNLTQAYASLAPDMNFYSLHEYLQQSTDSFIEQRYGGVSFGHSKDSVAPGVDELNSDSSLTLPFISTYSAAKVWYSLKGYHAMPAYLNTLNNAILRGNLNPTQQSEYGQSIGIMCLSLVIFHAIIIITRHSYCIPSFQFDRDRKICLCYNVSVPVKIRRLYFYLFLFVGRTLASWLSL